MKYFIIAGEASGDLHAAHLMRALRNSDPQAEFCCYGGDEMRRAGGTLLCHYRTLAYMGFIQVALHLPAILRGLSRCKQSITDWRPDAVILVDYPGFNLKVARFVREKRICPVFYYISPKIWAWKERRIKAIKRDVTHLYSILPFETAFFEKKHHYPITYVGNPSVDEVAAFRETQTCADQSAAPLIALLPGSRRHEVSDNLSRMLCAAAPFADYQLRIAAAPAIEDDFYLRIISQAGLSKERVGLVRGQTFRLLSESTAALVTSGTATLETALLGVPQVVCYYMRCGWFIDRVRPYFLKVPYISLVNLIANEEVVPELVAGGMTVENIRRHLSAILPGGNDRPRQIEGYRRMTARLGSPGAPRRAAADILRRLSAQTS